ncbi:MAG: GNAT family N-acetyltransferase [Firmicutes bacterium]|nr:GNAT family N-acetyltransferase [Bacillota bacterium]
MDLNEDVVKLIPPNQDYVTEIQNFLDSHYNHNGISDFREKMERVVAEEWIRQCNKHETARQFLGIRESDNKLIGSLLMYTEDTPQTEYWGNVSLNVIESERGKGYATQMLNGAREYASQIGKKSFKYVCYGDNTASVKTVLACGGKLVKEDEKWFGGSVHYYEIPNADLELERNIEPSLEQ